ncbi:DNA-directed RNA polymerase [Candidatus Woesearchaeota archaeon]|nr:DNA-directed RNA polymerase [Candidatus Woesearchaeota archaeon]
MRQEDNKRSGRNRDSGGYGSNYGSRDFGSEQREMHKAVCSECGNECEVPFKPTEGKPVYCKSCYANHKPKRF